MAQIGDKKEPKLKPLPKDLQDLVDREEADEEIRADFENSWTTTRPENNTLEHQPSDELDQTYTNPVNLEKKTD
ncbi:unnamed protein product [Penicillium glandicola]